MKISPDSWHFKLYRFNYQLVEAWKHNAFFYGEPDSAKKIGLCPYMRMILLWGPLVMATYLIPIGAVIFTFYSFPVYANGASGIIALVIVLVLGAASFIAFFFVAELIENRLQQIRERKASKINLLDPDAPPPPATFWAVFKEYLTSFKTKICPILEINDD